MKQEARIPQQAGFVGRQAGREALHRRYTEHSAENVADLRSVCSVCSGAAICHRTQNAPNYMQRIVNAVNVDVFVSLRWYYPVQVPRVLSQPRLHQYSTMTALRKQNTSNGIRHFLNERRYKLTMLAKNLQTFFFMSGGLVGKLGFENAPRGTGTACGHYLLVAPARNCPKTIGQCRNREPHSACEHVWHTAYIVVWT